MSFGTPKVAPVPPAPPPTAPDPLPQIETPSVAGTVFDALGNVNATKKKGTNSLTIPLDKSKSSGIQI